MRIAYDVRTGEWVPYEEVSYLPPEMFFEIKESPDDRFHNEFATADGGVYEFDYLDDEEFRKEYEPVKDKLVYRMAWSVPSKMYHEGLEYFNLK